MKTLQINSLAAFAFIVLGLALITACSDEQSKIDESKLYEREINGEVFDTAPVRGDLKLLRHIRSNFTYKCTECHVDFKNTLQSNDPKGEHKDLVLDHGFNVFCLNCHHPDNRNAYVSYDGSEIPSNKPAQLCRKCHGPSYREWQAGTHGRQNGYWDTSKGKQTKLLCIQCHDPHSPKFKSMKPDPAPRVSRLDNGETQATHKKGHGNDH